MVTICDLVKNGLAELSLPLGTNFICIGLRQIISIVIFHALCSWKVLGIDMRLFLYIIKKFQFFLYFQDIVFSFIAVLWQKFSVFLKETVHTFIQVLLCRQFTFYLLRAIYCQTTSGKTPHLWKSALGRWGNEVFKIFPRVGLDSQGKLPCAAKVGLMSRNGHRWARSPVAKQRRSPQ